MPVPRRPPAPSLSLRRLPDATRYSGVTCAATTPHAPPFLRTASSWIVGVPLSIARRRRISWFLSPSHVTVSASPATPAVKPEPALYAERLQFRADTAACTPGPRI